jgi:hypothetical protein
VLHPYFADLGPVDPNDPRRRGAHPFVDRAMLERMTRDWRVAYQDPLGQAPGGAAYQGAWIAAAQPFRLPGSGAGGLPEQMMVVVQERSAAATGPVEQLGRHLVGEGLLAVLAIALTVAALWFIVLRGRAGRDRPAPSEPALAVDPRPLRDRSTLSESGPEHG